MVLIDKEPVIKVGLLNGAQTIRMSLEGLFIDEEGRTIAEGDHLISVDGFESAQAVSLRHIRPKDFHSSRATVHDVTIGIDFHWERKESQLFQGALLVARDERGLTLINELPIESYLVSVISSEMSASCPRELLRAHAVVSRSWLLAQLERAGASAPKSIAFDDNERIRWYDRENHDGFDVCADDHCQRYQGVSKAFSEEAFDAVCDTRGVALVYGDEICDARYSKSCGGRTEVFSAAWEDRLVPYLTSIYDGPDEAAGYEMPLTEESSAERWILSSPAAYCNVNAKEILSRILPGFDQETTDFYRWRVEYSQDELRSILLARAGVDFGRILSLDPIERGESGRIIRLRITGEKRTLIIGKELEIRRALSRSHLYSSAFVVERIGEGEYFQLTGAGWGHGVGLCQIGAAVMAERGHTHEEILAHYFRRATLKRLY
ncbi:MAG: SpoIID/LytB domain-containing protein [Acidobacteriota bacterium]